jgi:hypothetical protein
MSATFKPLSALMGELPVRFVPKGIADELRGFGSSGQFDG